MVHKKNFVIVSLPRTGTTMLCIALDRLKGFNVYGEILVNRAFHMVIKTHPQEAIEALRQKNQPKNLYQFLSKRYNFTDKEFPLRRITNGDIDDYLDGIFSEAGNVGFKLLYPHMDRTPHVISYIRNRDLRIVHLYREDHLKQVISAFTNQHMHKHDGKKKMVLSDAEIKAIPNMIKDIQDKDKRLQDLFSGHNRYAKISYEDMTSDSDSDVINTGSISSLLDIPKVISSYTKKYGPTDIKDRIENWEDINV